MLHKDKPIEKIEEDLLNRVEFSHKLADTIIEWKHDNSWVIALTGNWGIGKTSVKNLIVSKIKQDEPKSITIDFSPWEWSSQDLIVSAFFKEIATKLEISDESKEHKELAEKIRTYLYYLNNITILTKPVIKTPSILFGILILGSLYFEKEFSIELLTNSILMVLAGWLIIFEGLGGFLKSLAERREHLANNKNKSVVDLKSSISESLNKINQPILIIIDDIDRLERHQILTVMQLVKSNTDFKNIVFLLLYSNSVLEKKISDNTQTGHEYMEKIVQVEFKVPEPDPILLRQHLIDKLEIILEKLKKNDFEKIFDNNYFTDIFYQQGLANYFLSLRSIYKFLNSFEFNLLMHFKNEFLEVNFIDFMVLEAIRIFEPELYIEIYKNKLLMLGKIPYTSSVIELKNEEKKEIAYDFIKNYSSSTSENLLKEIFPSFRNYIDDTLDTVSYEDKLNRNMISHESRFDRYFVFENPSIKISTYETACFFNNLNNKIVSEKYLNDMYAQNKFNSFLENTISSISRISDGDINTYFGYLDYLHRKVGDEGMISDKDRVVFLFTDSLKKFKQKQFTILNTLSKDLYPFSILPEVYESIRKRIHEYNIKESELQILCHSISENIEKLITNDLDIFAKHGRNLTFLLFWYDFDRELSKNHVNTLLQDPSSFFKTYSIFIRTKITTTSYSVSKTRYVDEGKLKLFINLEEFEKLLIDNSNLANPEDIELKNLFYNPKII